MDCDRERPGHVKRLPLAVAAAVVYESYLISAAISLTTWMDSDSDVEGESSSIIFALLGAVIAFILLSSTKWTEPDVSNNWHSILLLIHLNKFVYQLKHIPTIGQSNYLCSYFDALRTLFSGPTVVRKGCEKVKVWRHFCVNLSLNHFDSTIQEFSKLQPLIAGWSWSLELNLLKIFEKHQRSSCPLFQPRKRQVHYILIVVITDSNHPLSGLLSPLNI